MKTFLFLLLAFGLSFSHSVHGQTKAITEKGDTIYVYENGTWSFTLKDNPSNSTELGFLSRTIEIDTLTQKFTVSNKANKSVSSSIVEDFSLHYNDAKWNRVPPAQYNEEAEFAFVAKNNNIFCIAIIEEAEVGMENLLKIAIHTMETNIGGKVEILQSEFRNVNGTGLIHGVLNLAANNMKFTFDSYYYSSEKGSIQLSTWTGQNVHQKYAADIEELLNGFSLKE